MNAQCAPSRYLAPDPTSRRSPQARPSCSVIGRWQADKYHESLLPPQTTKNHYAEYLWDRSTKNDRDAVQHLRQSMKTTQNVSGRDFREIRSRCGYSAREFAEFLAEINAPITTSRSVYRLEELNVVPARYVDALQAFVGMANFKNKLEELRREEQCRDERVAARRNRPGQ